MQNEARIKGTKSCLQTKYVGLLKRIELPAQILICSLMLKTIRPCASQSKEANSQWSERESWKRRGVIELQVMAANWALQRFLRAMCCVHVCVCVCLAPGMQS